MIFLPKLDFRVTTDNPKQYEHNNNSIHSLLLSNFPCCAVTRALTFREMSVRAQGQSRTFAKEVRLGAEPGPAERVALELEVGVAQFSLRVTRDPRGVRLREVSLSGGVATLPPLRGGGAKSSRGKERVVVEGPTEAPHVGGGSRWSTSAFLVLLWRLQQNVGRVSGRSRLALGSPDGSQVGRVLRTNQPGRSRKNCWVEHCCD